MQESQMLTAEGFASNICNMPADNRLVETLAFRVTRQVYASTKEISETERREMADVERAIYDRGLAAYQRDGLLFEPVKPQQAQDQDQTAKRSPGKRTTG